MSTRLKKKTALIVAIVAIGLVAMGLTISSVQSKLTIQDYTAEMQQEASQLPDLLAQAQEDTATNTDNYDSFYQSKAASVTYMASHKAGYAATDAKMAQLKELLNVSNVMIVSKQGKIVAKAGDTKADFRKSRFNRLRTTFESGKPSKPVIVDLAEQGWQKRYYSSRIDDDTMVVIEQDPAELTQLVEDSSSTASVLKNISIGQDGYMFAVDARDYLIAYHPDSSLVGTDALQKGLDVAQLEDGAYSWMTLNGVKLYCGVTKIDDMYYIGAVPESSISFARYVSTGVTQFAFLIVMLLVACYGFFVLHDEERRGNTEEDFRAVGSKLRINKVIARKGAILSLVGFVAIVAVAFYMQTLFALSSESVSNKESATQLQQTITRTNERVEALRTQYNTRYLNKCRAAAYIIQSNPSLAEKAPLKELAEVLEVPYLYVFDATGKMTASNASYVSFKLSDDPSDQSYEFHRLLQGVDTLVQDAQADESTGSMRQYFGVALHDKAGDTTGFVQMSIYPDRLQKLMESVKIANVLDGVKVGADGFAFAVDKNTKKMAYFPDSNVMGRDAGSVGMTDDQIKSGLNDYVTVNGKTYYASSVESGDYYLYVAGSDGELMSERGPLTLLTALIDLICQILVFLLLIFERPAEGERAGELAAGESGAFDTVMPDGRRARTDSAASRWIPGKRPWHEKTPEQKVASIIKVLMGVFIVFVFLCVLFKDAVFPKNSLIAYILDGGWSHGLNIFALTASIMFACAAMTAATIVGDLLKLLATVLSARGETICRLLRSFIKYATIIGMVYYCLALLGVDTTTLLASAGILSIAVSFGAKELVSDILSGLFIIFEGEFRVGDIIKVGDWRGTVIEIGVRTTKIEDGSQNIKVIRNSNVSDIINMTRQTSVTWIDVGISYDESLEHVEAVLAKEFGGIANRHPSITAGPFYKGVVQLGDNSVIIRILVKCAEDDRAQVERDLNREIKLLFDKYDIDMPFPQVTVHSPVEKKTASFEEQAEASRFNEEQKESSKDAHADQSSSN